MKKLFAIIIAIMLLVTASGIVACGEEQGTTYTVTYYDATDKANMTVLKTEKVKEGDAFPEYSPTKEGGYQFVDWYMTPTKNHKFDKSSPITADISVYGGFTLFKEDTRTFYIVGSGTSKTLLASNWGKNIGEDYQLTKKAGANEYSITLDLYVDDEFQFAIGTGWENKRGFGYLDSAALADGTTVFDGQGSIYAETSKGTNIKVKQAGNYTLTLTTSPNEDYYDTNSATYTEEGKEVYNYGTYDKITWVRNGDVLETSVSVTDFYIKGSKITQWQTMVNDYTTMVKNGNNYTLDLYLNAGEEFMFASQVTKDNVVSEGSLYIKASNLDEASKAYIEGDTGNMKAKASGKYSFTYNTDTKVLKVAFDSTVAYKALDFYIDGTLKGGAWGDYQKNPADYKLIETASGSGVYEIKGVTLAVDEEICIRSYAAGTQTLGWDNFIDNLGIKYVKNASANKAFTANASNAKVVTAGSYDISIDAYSKIITIAPHTDSNDTLDVYIKGSGINGWDHGYKSEYVMKINSDGSAYELNLTVSEAVEFGLAKYGKGETTGYGDYIAASALGTLGDANSLFKPESGTNFKCSTNGSYKIVYSIATGEVNIYKT